MNVYYRTIYFLIISLFALIVYASEMHTIQVKYSAELKFNEAYGRLEVTDAGYQLKEGEKLSGEICDVVWLVPYDYVMIEIANPKYAKSFREYIVKTQWREYAEEPKFQLLDENTSYGLPFVTQPQPWEVPEDPPDKKTREQSLYQRARLLPPPSSGIEIPDGDYPFLLEVTCKADNGEELVKEILYATEKTEIGLITKFCKLTLGGSQGPGIKWSGDGEQEYKFYIERKGGIDNIKNDLIWTEEGNERSLAKLETRSVEYKELREQYPSWNVTITILRRAQQNALSKTFSHKFFF